MSGNPEVLLGAGRSQFSIEVCKWKVGLYIKSIFVNLKIRYLRYKEFSTFCVWEDAGLGSQKTFLSEVSLKVWATGLLWRECAAG